MGDDISIKVKTLDGQSRDVKVSKNATVMDLKARIEQLTKMPKNRQRIIFQGMFFISRVVHMRFQFDFIR